MIKLLIKVIRGNATAVEKGILRQKFRRLKIVKRFRE